MTLTSSALSVLLLIATGWGSALLAPNLSVKQVLQTRTYENKQASVQPKMISKSVTKWLPQVKLAVADAKARTGVDVPEELVLAMIHAESGGNPKARSRCGAYGLLQLMPGTAIMLGANAKIPAENVRGGALYIAKMLSKFKMLPIAIAAYNAGPGNIVKHKGIPPFKETRDYVTKVIKLNMEYRKHLRGETPS